MSERFELVEVGDARLAPAADLDVAVACLEGAAMGEAAAASAHRDQILAFVAGHDDAAHRTCQEGHLTGSALVVDHAGERTLLMLHRKLGRWFQPGGHADGDTNLASVAWREATEETGIEGLGVVVPAVDVDVHEVRPPGEAPHLHLDVRYLVIAPEGAVEHANHESDALRWLTEHELDDLDPPIDDSTRRLVARGLQVARSLRS